jgi:hypothetical protein
MSLLYGLPASMYGTWTFRTMATHLKPDFQGQCLILCHGFIERPLCFILLHDQPPHMVPLNPTAAQDMGDVWQAKVHG